MKSKIFTHFVLGSLSTKVITIVTTKLLLTSSPVLHTKKIPFISDQSLI